MELVLKARGMRLTDQIRRSTEHKFAKIERLDPQVRRVEVELIGDLNPRVGASHKVEVACGLGRRRFRAQGTGHDVETALDQAIQRLERQISTHKGKLRNRLLGRLNRLQSPGTSSDESSSQV